MKRQMIVAGLAALLATAGIDAARAAPGVVVQNVNLRAGPDVGYPLVEPLPAGTPIEIFGCLQGWTWCDVGTNDARGWAAGPTLQVVYNDQPVYLPQYGAAVGLGFVGFEVGDYWGRYYRNRPFYGERDRFGGGPGYAGGRGPGFAGGPPGGFHGGGEPGRGEPGRGEPGRGEPGRGEPGRGFAQPVGARPGPQRGPIAGPARGAPGPARGGPPAGRPAPGHPGDHPDDHH